jgi:hypothetical protein
MFSFSCRPALPCRILLEVEILEDRLPLSAPFVVAPPTATHTSPGGSANPAIPIGIGTVLNPSTPTGSPGTFGSTNPGPTGFTPLGPTGSSNPYFVAGQSNGPFGPNSPSLSDPLNRVSAYFSAVPNSPLLPTPFAGAQQQSSPGAALVNKTREISGIDSRVFDPRSQDRLSLRDQREVRGMGDPAGLLRQPPKVPVPPPVPSPGLTPSATYQPS